MHHHYNTAEISPERTIECLGGMSLSGRSFGTLGKDADRGGGLLLIEENGWNCIPDMGVHTGRAGVDVRTRIREAHGSDVILQSVKEMRQRQDNTHRHRSQAVHNPNLEVGGSWDGTTRKETMPDARGPATKAQPYSPTHSTQYSIIILSVRYQSHWDHTLTPTPDCQSFTNHGHVNAGNKRSGWNRDGWDGRTITSREATHRSGAGREDRKGNRQTIAVATYLSRMPCNASFFQCLPVAMACSTRH